jgi:hypothetical protein
MSIPQQGADNERAVTLFKDDQVIGHIRYDVLNSDEDGGIADGGYVAIGFPHNLKLWAPASLGSSEREQLLNKFATKYAAPRDAEVLHHRFWQAGIIFIPPAVVFLLGAALIWAFSGFRQKQT